MQRFGWCCASATQAGNIGPSADTRSIYAFPGNDFVVIVVRDPVPDEITVTRSEESTEPVKPTWNTDLDVGFARFSTGAGEVVSVEGP